jgi:hypothetical protein
MPTYLVRHHHDASECGAAFAAWRGFRSPLRGSRPMASCRVGDHTVWWTVVAPSARDALGQLPDFVARRAEAVQIEEVHVR